MNRFVLIAASSSACVLISQSSPAQDAGAPAAPAASAPQPGVSSSTDGSTQGQVSLGTGGVDADGPDSAPSTGTDKKNGIYGDLSLGVMGIGYERVLGTLATINLTAQYYRPWYVSDHVFGFGGELRPFFFVTDDAPSGLYFSPGLRVAYVRADVEDPNDPNLERSEDGVAWSVKTTVGYGVVIRDIFSARVGVGVQSHQAELVPGNQEPDFTGAYPAVDLYLGLVL